MWEFTKKVWKFWKILEKFKKKIEILEAKLNDLKQKSYIKQTYKDYRRSVVELFTQAKNYGTFIVFGIYATFFSLWWSLGETGLPIHYKEAGKALIYSATIFGVIEIIRVFYQSISTIIREFKSTKKIETPEEKPEKGNSSEENQEEKKAPLPLGWWIFAVIWFVAWIFTVGFGGLAIWLLGQDLLTGLQ